MIYYIVIFVITLSILIAVHELGHFLLARYYGVKVLRFSIGFGKPIYKWQDRSGTEYVLAIVPLGGYVKMLDEPLPGEDPNCSLSKQPILQRCFIACAGPVFNLLFAVLAFWLMYMIGITSLAPVIGYVSPGSVADNAGLRAGYEITAIDKQVTQTWQKVQLALVVNQKRRRPVIISLKDMNTGQIIQHSLDLTGWQITSKPNDPLSSFGIAPYIDSEIVITEVTANSPAAQAGLQKGDKIIAINDNAINSWQQFTNYLHDNAAEGSSMMIQRSDQYVEIDVMPELRKDGADQEKAYLGIRAELATASAALLRIQRFNPVVALGHAVKETVFLTGKTFDAIGKLILGKIPLRQMSGPVGIAQGAKQSASIGLTYYLSFLAIVSIGLAVINLLPIPMLDGGHIVYYVIEWIRGGPLSQGVQLLGFKMGLFLLATVMVVTAYNDIIKIVN
ncbi:MAG: RIP metalloprotease RseP [Gammaproteobacteria bacterium]